MVSKLFYLLMDWETTIIKEPALEQVRSAIRASQTSKAELFSKITSNIKTYTILPKMSIFDAWLGPESASEAGHNTVPKIQTEICKYRSQVKMESL